MVKVNLEFQPLVWEIEVIVIPNSFRTYMF